MEKLITIKDRDISEDNLTDLFSEIDIDLWLDDGIYDFKYPYLLIFDIWALNIEGINPIVKDQTQAKIDEVTSFLSKVKNPNNLKSVHAYGHDAYILFETEDTLNKAKDFDVDGVIEGVAILTVKDTNYLIVQGKE